MNSPVVGKRAHTAESGWHKQSVRVSPTPSAAQRCPPEVPRPLFLLHPSSASGETQAPAFSIKTEIFFFSIFYLNRSDWSISADMQILQNRTKNILQPYNTRIVLLMLESRVFSLSFTGGFLIYCIAPNHKEVHLAAERCLRSKSWLLQLLLKYKALKFVQKYFRTPFTFGLIFFFLTKTINHFFCK